MKNLLMTKSSDCKSFVTHVVLSTQFMFLLSLLLHLSLNETAKY